MLEGSIGQQDWGQITHSIKSPRSMWTMNPFKGDLRVLKVGGVEFSRGQPGRRSGVWPSLAQKECLVQGPRPGALRGC